jgi:hypothetical protein
MMLPVVKVKRDGPKGWHWINASDYDPARHELVDPPETSEPATEPPADAPKRRGRPPKQQKES